MEGSLDTIYRYTEFCVSKTIDNLKGLDSKLGIFIGFSAVLIRLAADLLSPWFRISVCVLALLVIVVCAISLKGSNVGPMAHPSVLMTDKWFQQGGDVHQGYIISAWIESLEDLDKVIIRKQRNLLLVIFLFSLSVISYGLGVILS